MKMTAFICMAFAALSISAAFAAPADDQLREAVTSGNVVKAEEAVRDGADINLSQDGNSPLMLALARGDGAMAETLIRCGARSEGVTPLFIAVLKGDVEAAKAVIKATPQKKLAVTLNAINRWKENALHYAVRSKNTAMITLLLKSGINVDQRDELGQTPLMWAVEEDSAEIINLLVDYKAHINTREKDGKTPLFRAVSHGKAVAVATLVKRGCGVNILDKERNSALSIALITYEGYADRSDAEGKAMTARYTAIIDILRAAKAIESGEYNS